MGRARGFDVVVVGGGTAGCVMAARLAASADRSVLLLEAGPDLRTDLPDEFRDGWRLTRQFDWGYKSEPDVNGHVQDLRRVKLLGGTSWVTRFALRGAPADYDEWKALGNPGWGFADVLPYLKRRYRDLDLTEIGAVALQACEAAGFSPVEDHNRPGAVGSGRMPMSSQDGIRVTTADAYLSHGSMLRNLTIRSDAQVSDIVFTGARATGVHLLDGTLVEASWVVVCAGTYGSPLILMRSGIGPAGHLRSVGLPVRIDLPGVGENLADHPAAYVDFGYDGVSRATPILHSIVTFHSREASPGGPPDLMFWLSDPVGTPAEFGIEVVLLKPQSRGTVRLRSGNPLDPPRIELPNFRERVDLDRLVEGYRRGWEIATRPEVRHLCAGSAPREMGDDQELGRAISADPYSLPHVVGTCAMGSYPEDGAVVDASGQVYGTERLMVVDASIMPTVPSGFTHIPTIMLAERLAEQLAARL